MSQDSLSIIFVSNGPGELATWVKPLAEQLHKQIGLRPRANNSAISLNKDQKGPSKKKYGDWIDYFSELALEGLRRRQFGEEHLLGGFLKIIKEKGPFTLQKQKDG